MGNSEVIFHDENEIGRISVIIAKKKKRKKEYDVVIMFHKFIFKFTEYEYTHSIDDTLFEK